MWATQDVDDHDGHDDDDYGDDNHDGNDDVMHEDDDSGSDTIPYVYKDIQTYVYVYITTTYI